MNDLAELQKAVESLKKANQLLRCERDQARTDLEVIQRFNGEEEPRQLLDWGTGVTFDLDELIADLESAGQANG